MKTCGCGGRGSRAGCMLAWIGVMSPLRRLHGAQEATMFSQEEAPPFERGMTWSTVRLVRESQYWQVQLSRAKTARRGVFRRGGGGGGGAEWGGRGVHGRGPGG